VHALSLLMPLMPIDEIFPASIPLFPAAQNHNRMPKSSLR